MAQIANTFISIKILEKIFISLTFIAIVIKYIFNYGSVLDIFVFSGVLAILYFPLGFYYLGKPSISHSYLISIILGLIYSSGIITLLLGALNIEGYKYPLVIDFTALLITISFLLFKLKSDTYSKEYTYAQFLRIGFIVITNLIVLFK
jgi:hypothetical protein